MRPEVLVDLRLFRAHVGDRHAPDGTVLIDHIEGAVIGEVWYGETGQRSQRLFVVERPRQRQRRFREEGVALRHSRCLLFCALPIGDIARNLRRADDGSTRIENG